MTRRLAPDSRDLDRIPTPDDLDRAPELAILAALDHTLTLAATALVCAQPELCDPERPYRLGSPTRSLTLAKTLIPPDPWTPAHDPRLSKNPRDSTTTRTPHGPRRPRLLIPRLSARRRDVQISPFSRDRQHFPLPRWRRGGAVGAAALDRVAAFAESASPHALDGSLRRARHGAGYASRASVPPGAPWHADRAGSLTPLQAALVSATTPPELQSEAVTLAQAVTLRRLEAEQGGTVHGDGGISFFAPAAAANVFRLSLVAVQRHLATRGQTGAGVTGALAWILDHATATWSEQGARFRDYADLERDGWRCTAPGCTARRNLQSHHIEFRSHGGPLLRVGAGEVLLG